MAAVSLILVLANLSCRTKDEDDPPIGPYQLTPPILFVFTSPSGDLFCYQTDSVLPVFTLPVALRSPAAAMLNRVGDRIFVLDSEANTLNILHLPGFYSLRRASVGGNPLDLDLSPSGSPAFILTRNGNFWRYSVGGDYYDTLGTGLSPRRFALRPPNASEAWIACPGDNTIHILDLMLFRPADTIHTEGGPTDVAFSPDGSVAYVAISGSTGAISTYNATSRLEYQRREAGAGPLDLAVSTDGHCLAAADSGVGRVMFWRTDDLEVRTEVDSIPGAGNPLFSKQPDELYVISASQRCVLRLEVTDSTAMVTDTFASTAIPGAIALWESTR